MEDKMTALEFVVKAIQKLRKPPYKGIHTVFSGFNAALREYFPGMDPVIVVNDLRDAGKIQSHFAKGGCMIYLPGDAPKMVDRSGANTLAKILA